jgi:SAM-dependent methyltransferase
LTPTDRLSIFCCPDCKSGLRVIDPWWTPSRRIKSGILFCDRCQHAAGAIRNFKFDFVHFDRTACARRLAERSGDERGPHVLPWEVIDEAIAFDDPRLCLEGSWEACDGKYQLSHGGPGDALTYSGEFVDVGVRLLKHPWSGMVRFEVDGTVVGCVDLYAPKWSTVHWFPIECDLPAGRHTVRILPAGEKNRDSAACQVFFHELAITRPDMSPDRPQPAPEANRVLPVFPDVVELMKSVREDGLILDCGGGDRVLADPRYINLDFEEYQLPAVYGDVLKLPFRENTFDLVFSQAVLEHVRDPFQAVEEMRRVTRPGGTVWAGMAFLQPVHAVPCHYFNATAWGIEELFRNLHIVRTAWFGDLSFTIDWLFKTAGVAERADQAEYADLMQRIKSLDHLVSYEDLKGVASGVSVEALKNADKEAET